MRVIAAPGQGSQKPGFLEPWLALPGARHKLDQWSAEIGIDLVTHGTVSDAETIRDTKVAQPLIVAAGLLSGRAVLAALGDEDIALAGHSVGEFTACALAGVMSDEEALRLVAVRGAAMAEASAVEPTGMAAVLGVELASIEPVLREHGLEPANVNGAGQVVAAGPKVALDWLKENPPEGTRVIPLEVAGAFHTGYMESALARVTEAASTIEPLDPRVRLYSNRDGAAVSSGKDALDRLVAQVTRPVRWDLCMQSFVADRAQEIIELTPAGALVGLAKRAMGGVATRRIDLPEQLDDLST
jgi:[acyl-carrier-protein] S-malonyltransferase